MQRLKRNERIVYLEADGVTLEYKTRARQSQASIEAEARAWLADKHPTVSPESLKLGFFPPFKSGGE